MNNEKNKNFKRIKDINLHAEKKEIKGKPNAYKNIFMEDNQVKVIENKNR